jgi:hypothetical protein
MLTFLTKAKELALLCYNRDVFKYVNYIVFKDHALLIHSNNTVKDLINKDIRDIILIKKNVIVNKVLVREEKIINTLLVTIMLYNQT